MAADRRAGWQSLARRLISTIPRNAARRCAIGNVTNVMLRLVITLGFAFSHHAIYAADRPPNAQAAYAAARIWGYILKEEATLALCRDRDNANAVAYDRIYDDYRKSAEAIMGRIHGIILEESIRSNLAPETSFKRLDPAGPRLAAQEAADTNPSRFVEECRNWPNISAEDDAREVDPADMKLIEDWR